MAPPRQACEILLTLHNKIYTILKKIEENRLRVNTYAGERAKKKFGFISLLDIIGAEAVSAIGSLAASVAESLIGPISRIASTFVEAILSQILKILLSFPTAIFSLVAIPHEAALKAINDERYYLFRAQKSISIVMGILGKWALRISNAEYYKQIKDAIPYLNNAINLLADMIRDLGADNAFFNESTYKKIHFNIQQAYEITKPYSLIDDIGEVTKRVEEERYLVFQEKKAAIDKIYIAKTSDLKHWYNNQFSDKLSITQTEIIKNKYDAYNTGLQTEWKEKLNVAELETNASASVNLSSYAKAVGGIASEFSFDIKLLGDEISNVYENMKNAYEQYIEYHNLCNTIYNIRNLIKNLINEIVSILKGSGNAAGATLIGPLDSASTLLEVTRDMFSKITVKDSNFEMASKIILGHTTIGIADETLHATITQSLIDMINADDVLQSSNQEFDEFIHKLYNIPDWDTKIGVWTVDVLYSATPPYIQLIADAFTLITTVMSDKENAYNIITTMESRFRQLFNHNNYVKNVLESYQPYKTSEAGDLTRMLSSAGLLDIFAKGLSVANIIENIISNTRAGKFNESIPTLKNCSKYYKDLYGDPAVAETFVMSMEDVSVPQYNNEYIQDTEEKLFDRMGARKYAQNFSVQNLIDEKSFITPPD
jgi:hypothetical protein